jgi:hypothetical protein
MWIVMSEELRAEVSRWALSFTCERCRHFVEPPPDVAQEPSCDVLYPTAPHRDATYAATPDGERVFFCKMYESR